MHITQDKTKNKNTEEAVLKSIVMFCSTLQSGVTLTMACVLGGINLPQMILTGRWHLVRRPLLLLVRIMVKEDQVR